MKPAKCYRCGKEYAVLIDSKITHQNPEYKSIYSFKKVCTTCFMHVLEHEGVIDHDNKITETGRLLAKDNVK